MSGVPHHNVLDSVTTSLPRCFLDSLKLLDDVKVRDGEISIYELVNSRGGNSAFLDILGDDKEADPLIYPSFGNPLNPYISPLAQIEVFNLLATFQPLKSQDLVVNVFPFIVAFNRRLSIPPCQEGYPIGSVANSKPNSVCSVLSGSLCDTKRNLRL